MIDACFVDGDLDGIKGIMKKTEEDSELSNWSKLRIINECTLALLDLGVKTSATRLKIQN